jgi:hypothetical protein
MKPVNLGGPTGGLKMALAQVKEDREELRQERDDWRRERVEAMAAQHAIKPWWHASGLQDARHAFMADLEALRPHGVSNMIRPAP